jgi:quercetin dioxygenase-like cupin family protein
MAARVGQAQGTQAPPPPLFQQDLPNLTLDGWQVTVSEITLPPGESSRPHRHPGFVVVCILEGEIVAKVSGGAETTYRPGQMFYEHPGSTHEINRNLSATRPAKFLAIREER